MAVLEELLRMQGRSRKREEAWKLLTSGSVFSDALREAVWHRSIGAVRPLLERWGTFKPLDEQMQMQLPYQRTIARVLLDSAEPAIEAIAAAELIKSVLDRLPNRPVSVNHLVPVLHTTSKAVGLACDCNVDHGELEMRLTTQGLFGTPGTARAEEGKRQDVGTLATAAVDVIFRFLADKLPADASLRSASGSQISWFWDLTRFLLDKPRRVVCSRTVSVAGTDEKGAGFLADLVLTVLALGWGGVFHDYQDAFHTRVNGPFSASMRDAWASAHALLHGQDTDVPSQDGRWQIRVQGKPLEEANDRSASGAAAWGWWHALTNKIPDERVIVVAQVDERNIMQLQEVDGIAAKTRAIIEANRFDTIAVASAANKAEAECVLKEHGKLGPIRVVIPDGVVIPHVSNA